MRIAIDAMGGANASGDIIEGALESIELLDDNDEMILVGPQDIIEPQLPSEKTRKCTIGIVDAPQVIDMDGELDDGEPHIGEHYTFTIPGWLAEKKGL